MWEQAREIFRADAERMVRAAAHLLPGLIVMVLLVFAAALLALATRALVRRACERLDLDRRLRELGMAGPQVDGRAPPSLVVARLAGWTVLALGVVLGLNVFETTSAFSLRLLGYLPHLLVAVVILVAGAAAARAVERGILIGAVNLGLQSARLLGVGVRWLVITLAVAMALDHLGVGGTILIVAFSLFFGGIVLALALATGLGARELVARSLEKHFSPPPESVEKEGEDALHHM